MLLSAQEMHKNFFSFKQVPHFGFLQLEQLFEVGFPEQLIFWHFLRGVSLNEHERALFFDACGVFSLFD